MSRTAPQGHVFNVWLFLRGLGLVYFLAFLSFGAQYSGLIGSEGLFPVQEFLDFIVYRLREDYFFKVPTLFWWNASDLAIGFVCFSGVVSGFLLFVGFMPWVQCLWCWVAYLSIVSVGQMFMSFQWDVLLLEVGLLGLLLSPWTLRAFPVVRAPASLVWVGRFVFFKLMLLSGLVKILSGDSTWSNLSALSYHYYTQPIPNPLAFYANLLPDSLHMMCVITMFIVELLLPFAIFAHRWVRHRAFFGFLILQLLIAFTGNYGFFNLLSVVLSVLMIDSPRTEKIVTAVMSLGLWRRGGVTNSYIKWPFILAYIALVVILNFAIALRTFGVAVPGFYQSFVAAVRPYGVANSYGLFAVMTTQRNELILLGSNNGVYWREYDFFYKPGPTNEAPPFLMSHMPRLDWQMWFAALAPQRYKALLNRLATAVKEEIPAVMRFIETNPFPEKPPSSLKWSVCSYRFSSYAEKSATGQWWQRQCDFETGSGDEDQKTGFEFSEDLSDH